MPVILLLLVAVLSAADAGPGINGVVIPLSTPRVGGPIPVEIRLTAPGGAREGRVRITVSSDSSEPVVWEGPDWRIGVSPTRFRALLPPAMSTASGDMVADLAWIGPGGGQLGSFKLSSGDGARSVAAIVGSAGREHALRGLAMPAAREGERRRSEQVVTTIVPVDLAPNGSASWCAYDAVVIAAETPLSSTALAGLCAWMRAGGRVLLVGADRSAVSQALSAAAAGEPIQVGECSMRSAGLGWFVTTAATASDPGTALWDGVLDPDSAEDASAKWGNPGAQATYLQHLLQSGVKPQVSRWLLSGIFAAFLLWIGPGEWWLLGKLRRRRWTWITFPLVAVATAVVVVLIAQAQLGGGELSRRLTIVDCDADGIPCLVQQHHTRFAGSDRVATDRPDDALLVRLPVVDDGRFRSSGTAGDLVYRGPWQDGGEIAVRLPRWTAVTTYRVDCTPEAEIIAQAPPWSSRDTAAEAKQKAVDAGFVRAGGASDRPALGEKREPTPAEVAEAVAHMVMNVSDTMLRRSPSSAVTDLGCRATVCVARIVGDDIIIWRRHYPTPIPTATPRKRHGLR